MPVNYPVPGRYIDPLVDAAFKKIFGSEPNKDLLIHFLNQVLSGRKLINDLHYSKNEHPGSTTTEGGAIFDLLCTGPDGEQFIIKVQRGSQQFFKSRAVFYTSRLISDQAPKGNRGKWAYQLPEVYLIALLENFLLPGVTGKNYMHNICLWNRETGEVFYDKLNYTFIELNNFVKTEAELETDLDNWLYVLKHLSRMNQLPVYLRKPVFQKLFNNAEYANLTKEEKMNYDTNMKYKWDNENVMDFAIEQAKEQERKYLTFETAKKLKKEGVSISIISNVTGLDAKTIEEL